MEIGSIKLVFTDWIKKNIEKIIIVIFILVSFLYLIFKFQEIIDSQKSVINEIEKQNQIHKIELEKVTEAYMKESKILQENMRIYQEQLTKIENNYKNDVKTFEKNKMNIASTIITESGGDSAKVAEAVAAATGFTNEIR